LGLAAPDANPEQNATFHDEINEIAGAIAALPQRTRDVLMLRRVAGLSQRETADRLAIAEKTVEKHMARGVLMLMTRFGRGGKSASQSSNDISRAGYHQAKNVRDIPE
jgi:RNA polymerase sigma-70 factor (ECF subfamily)